MKIKKLKEILNRYDDSYEIVLSSDAEGNTYHRLDDIDECVYVPDRYEGEIYPIESDDEDELYQEDDGEKALVFYP